MQKPNKQEQIQKLIIFIDEDLKQLNNCIHSTKYVETYRAEKIYAELMLDWNRLSMLIESENKTNENNL